MNRDSQWNKQKACVARANQVWLVVNRNTIVTSDERIRRLKRFARTIERGRCQSNLYYS